MTMILKSNQEELIDLIQRVHNEINPAIHELRTPYISAPIEKFLEKELLSREELKTLHERILDLGYGNIAVDLGRDQETLKKHLTHKRDVIKNQIYKKNKELTEAHRVRIKPDGLEILDKTTEPHWKSFSYEFLYRARINSDGTGYFEDNDIYFDLRKIDDPLLFFSKQLLQMERQDVSRYPVNMTDTYELISINNEMLLGALDEIIVMDSEFLTFRGWFFTSSDELVRGERTVLLANMDSRHFVMLRTKATYRKDVVDTYREKNGKWSGFFCRVEKERLHIGMSYQVMAGYKIGRKLYMKKLDEMPAIDRFML